MNSLNLECSNCAEHLLDLNIDNTVKTTFSLIAKCPFCNDKSFKKEINGTFSYLPAMNKKTKKPNTIIKDITYESDCVIILLEKFNG